MSWAQTKPASSNALFVQNKGQWTEDFHHKVRINGGAFFFEDEGLTLVIQEPEHHTHDEPHKHTRSNEYFALQLRWQNAEKPYVTQESVLQHKLNYLLGNDKSKWRSGVSLSKELRYSSLYNGIHLRYFGNGPHLEYDIEVDAFADPSQIAYRLEGQESIKARGNELEIKTPYGTLRESIPYAYQEINGNVYEVSCTYQIKNGVVSFKLGNYNKEYPLVIDPVLNFSTLTGSGGDNWGLTATYDDNGNMYAGGVVFSSGYPITTGVFQSVYAGGTTDLSITKFNSNGTQALYSTLIGGSGTEVAHSMITAPDGTLYILGNTESKDFPIGTNAYQDTNYGGTPYTGFGFQFPNGSDIFVVALSPDGSTISAGTFLGGDGVDGVNEAIMRNYGDMSRGEVVLDAQNNVYITTSCSSSNMNFNGTIVGVSGNQDAVIASFNPALSALRWGTLLGGSSNEAGYSLKIDGNNKLFTAGATTSSDLNLFGNASLANAQAKGQLDGYIYKLDAQTGVVERGTYTGGANDDQNFFVTLDRSNKVYTYGQTNSALSTTPGVYRTINARQFITKFDNNLSNIEMRTTVGSGPSNYNLVPTAFLVDDCYKIYISGWNGLSNRVGSGSTNGSTYNLPVTNDAYQSTTDGSDFYFMVLERNADSLVFATFFGGTSNEHVDGGTSRFDPKGIVYQAVCAACSQQGFPTTPGAYSETNGSTNCNLGAIKFDFQSTVRARGQIDYTADVDTVCNTLFVDFTNRSINADVYQWDLGNGQTSTQREPRATYQTFGTYTITLVAFDTICDLVDTFSLSLVHDQGVLPQASFTVDYNDCDKTYEARFTNTSNGSSNYEWDFGDGSPISNAKNPIHNFPAIGVYTVTLTAKDTLCTNQDDFQFTVEFTDTIPPPDAGVSPSECLDGSLNIHLVNQQDWYSYTWEDGTGRSFTGESPRIVFKEPGFYNITMMVFDSVCNAQYQNVYPVRLGGIQNEVFIPNAFTPNGDGKNEKFEISGNRCTKLDHLVISNRWGQIVFETYYPYTEFWDGTINGGATPAKQDVYLYALQRGKEIQRGIVSLVR